MVHSKRLWVGVPYLIYVTTMGATVADCDLYPAGINVAQVNHSLAIVNLSETLLTENPGSTWITERELRRDRMRAAQGGESWQRQRRTPDGMLVLEDGKLVAVEVDLTPKRTKKFELLVQAYGMDREIYRVWWYLPNATTMKRMQEVADQRGIGMLIETRLWKGEL